jgi:thioredoxin-related protein
MKRVHVLLALAAAIVAIGSHQLQAAEESASAWTEDLQAAIKEAKKSDKVLMIEFTGSDWCGFCVKQNQEVFAKEEFQAFAKENLVLMKADFPSKRQMPEQVKKQNAELKAKYAVSGFPTLVFVNAKGEELGRMRGYAPGSGVEKWLARAKEIVAKKS